MENLRLLFRLYIRPADTMSDIMDRGSWLFSVLAVFLVSMLFFATVVAKLSDTYRIPNIAEYVGSDAGAEADPVAAEASYERSIENYRAASAARSRIPVVGDLFFKFFSFEQSTFYIPVLAIPIFYIPLVVLLVSMFASLGSFGLLIRRDYATLATCSLMSWTAAHLPFAVAGAALFNTEVGPPIYLALWVGSSLLFGLFMIFALRTVLGVNYGAAILAVALGWIAFTIALYVFQYVSPWLLSPFLLFFVIMHFGGSLTGELRGYGNTFRQRQNFKRFLHNATVNPRDADAHVQLGLIYQQRRQDAKATEHFEKAIEIDATEIDANYQLGRIAREKADLQKALDHFAIVLEQDEKFSLNEIWREIGATYLSANMFIEATDALEKYVELRPVDPEGLYYCGKALKGLGKNEKAREMFEQAVDSVKSSPQYRRREIERWAKLAEKEL